MPVLGFRAGSRMTQGANRVPKWSQMAPRGSQPLRDSALRGNLRLLQMPELMQPPLRWGGCISAAVLASQWLQNGSKSAQKDACPPSAARTPQTIRRPTRTAKDSTGCKFGLQGVLEVVEVGGVLRLRGVPDNAGNCRGPHGQTHIYPSHSPARGLLRIHIDREAWKAR